VRRLEEIANDDGRDLHRIGGMIRAGDNTQLRKERGAFFTPTQIADYLARWAVGDDPNARILDPTCGEAVFLLSAGRLLRSLGAEDDDLKEQLFGVDLHQSSLDWAHHDMCREGIAAQLTRADFFDVGTPDQLTATLPAMDAVVGNPPFVRYQRHSGDARARSLQAALRQQVRLSGLASSWAALLVHACGFLKPEGRLAMVLPAELLTVGYAEPVRAWLRERFEQVHLVLFERLQFADATEKVVLLLASGEGGCDAFSLYTLSDSQDLAAIRPMTNLSVTPSQAGKWTDLLLPNQQRRLFKSLSAERFVPLSTYGKPELGTVTGANNYFTLTEATRKRYGLIEGRHVVKVCPPGTKHLHGLSFSEQRWAELRDLGGQVWLLHASVEDQSEELAAYLEVGIERSVPTAYKCRTRTPWWRPPVAPVPDFFFTYMSHHFPRLMANSARTTYLNSMHGVSLRPEIPPEVGGALPLVMLNSVTLLGAELHGRSYGGGVLKMEPREAAELPLPTPRDVLAASNRLSGQHAELELRVAEGDGAEVVRRVDGVLLRDVMRLSEREVRQLQAATGLLRSRRQA
jgi:adenine-specific DNA-methyltransferase